MQNLIRQICYEPEILLPGGACTAGTTYPWSPEALVTS